MNKEILVVSFASLDEKSGKFNNPYVTFALPNENIDQTVESLRWAIAIQLNGPLLDSYQDTLKELDARKEQLSQLIDGKIENFEIEDTRYSVKILPFEPGLESHKDWAEVRPGTRLYIQYDKKGNELGVFAEDDGKLSTRFINFFRTSNPQTLTLYHYLPFVIEGKVGYMINHEQERVGSLMMYAKPMAGFYFFVVDSEDNGYIVDVLGRKVTESPTRIDFDNPGYNGYIIFMEGDKYGFIHAESGTKSPVIFDGIDTVEIGEAVRVKKGDEWGFLTETFEFISENAIEEDDCLTDDIYWYGDE